MGVIPRLTTPSEFRHFANGLEYELATPGLDAGGRALFEAKQLGLEQCFHERREVDVTNGPFRRTPVAGLVICALKSLLAGP
jgi:hypothetical protein